MGSATVLVCQAGCAVRHDVLLASMALRMTRSLRMRTVSASFLAFPMERSRSQKVRVLVLWRAAARAASCLYWAHTAVFLLQPLLATDP